MSARRNIAPRENMINALNGKQPTGQVPHFELVFRLTMEAVGKVHPYDRHYLSWQDMTAAEKNMHRKDIASTYLEIAEKYHHSAIVIEPKWQLNNPEEISRIVEIIRDISGDKYFLLTHGEIPGLLPGSDLENYSYRLMEAPAALQAETSQKVEQLLERANTFYRDKGLDGLALCCDYCSNMGPFISPSHFSEFVVPYLKRLIEGYKGMGFYVIKHTDGNIMPIIDQLVDCKPHALHSLDPQAGIDIALIKKKYGKQLCLIGNVNCGLLNMGTDEECIASALYALKSGMPGGGYIYSTSNSIYPGLDLRRYELIWNIWMKHGWYGQKEVSGS